MLFLFLWLTVTAEHIINEFSSRYGYIGPACAVEDGQLFLHGVLVRNLSDTEADEFKKYQHLLQTFKRLSENRQIADAPVIPPFCGGVDDSTEIVLKDCIVRNLHVYVGETLLRPLNNKERQKILSTINRRSSRAFNARSLFLRRFRNDLQQKRIKRESQPTGENISDLIHRYLKINSSITARFLPVVGQSAIFSPLNEWDPIAKKPISAPNSSEMFSFTKVTNSPTPIPPDTTKATNLTTSEYLKTLIPSRPTRSRSIAETTTSLEPIRRFGHFARKPPTRWDLMNASAQLSQYAKTRKETKSEETVNDPTILSIIARALSNNDPSILREIGKNESRNGSIVDKEIGKEELKTTSAASSTSLESISNPSLSPLRAGTRTIIGGKAYIAVPIDRFAVDSFEETTTMTGEPTSASVSFPTITSTTTTSTSTIPTELIKLTQSKKPNKRKYPSNLDFDLPDEICHAHLRITSKKERFL